MAHDLTGTLARELFDAKDVGGDDALFGNDWVQARLSNAIERARLGEDRELTQEVRDRGEALANLLYGLLRATRLYAANNVAFDAPIAETRACVEHLTTRVGPVSLVCVEDQVYVNDVRVHFGERVGKPAELGRELGKHNVGGVGFEAVPDAAELRVFVAAFARQPDPSSPRAALLRAFREGGVRNIELSGIYRFPKVGELSTGSARTVTANEVAQRAFGAIERMWSNAAAGRIVDALPLRRVVAEALSFEDGLEALLLNDQQAPPFVMHALRVALFASALGKAVDLPGSVLQDLGVAALTHDVGYAVPEAAQSQASAALSHLAAHRIEGARLLAIRRGFHEAKVRRVLAVLHHHRDHAEPGERSSLFARILRIAEDFDNYSRPEAGGLSPYEALAAMGPHAGTRYDPVLFQLFMNTVGRFPPGTLLELADGRIVQSVSFARSIETFATPRARLVRGANGRPPREPEVVDLAEVGRPRRALRALP